MILALFAALLFIGLAPEGTSPNAARRSIPRL